MLSLGDNLYQKCYCEENIYHLASKAVDFEDKNDNKINNQTFVIFISSENRCVPIWQQKMNESDLNDDPVLWDYHVVLLRQEVDENCFSKNIYIYDFDTRLPFPSTYHIYLSQCFKTSVLSNIKEEFSPLFRVVKAKEFLDNFASDRRHMKTNTLIDSSTNITTSSPKRDDPAEYIPPPPPPPSSSSSSSSFTWLSPPPKWNCIQGQLARTSTPIVMHNLDDYRHMTHDEENVMNLEEFKAFIKLLEAQDNIKNNNNSNNNNSIPTTIPTTITTTTTTCEEVNSNSNVTATETFTTLMNKKDIIEIEQEIKRLVVD